MRTTSPWQDPRTGTWHLKRRIPTRYLGVATQRGGQIKLSLGTADRREAMRRWPSVLQKWAEMEAEWERLLNTTTATPDLSREITAKWAAWVASGAHLDTGGESSDIFDALSLPEERTPENLARLWDRVEVHAEEALRVAGVTITMESRRTLLEAMAPVVAAAYLDADLRQIGVSGHPAMYPLARTRADLPPVPDAPLPHTVAATVAIGDLFDGWKRTATVKSRTVTETEYILALLEKHLRHDDATRITRADLAGWRDVGKAGGITNNTWNNRLSLVRQVFEWGANEGHLASNPADASLRLRKNKVAVRLPYTDAEATLILEAARRETRATLRWAHWIMAFTGMRAGEVLQLSAADVREQDGVPFLAIHEDDAEKSVKTGARRNVPIHPALVAEGLLAYARSLPKGSPLFPDKALDAHGNRGGRAWNVTGKWVRRVVGITDTAKAPDHSWRHRMEDELRAAEVPEDARDAIVGHARKTTGRVYGVRGEALRRLHDAVCRVPLPDGLTTTKRKEGRPE